MPNTTTINVRHDVHHDDQAKSSAISRIVASMPGLVLVAVAATAGLCAAGLCVTLIGSVIGGAGPCGCSPPPPMEMTYYSCPSCGLRTGESSTAVRGASYVPTAADVEREPLLSLTVGGEVLRCTCGHTFTWYDATRSVQ